MSFSCFLQVLSKTVANALESMGKPELSSTILFIRTINDWFDCLNVANTKQHFAGRNANLEPYKSVDDERLKVCLELSSSVIWSKK